jgi:hypothetical protein
MKALSMGLSLSAQKTALTAAQWIGAWAIALSIGVWTGTVEEPKQGIGKLSETTTVAFE